MVETAHSDRLLARLQAAETPLVEVWGWPGSGKRRLLRALAERAGERARLLPRPLFARPEALGAEIASARADGVEWLVALDRPPAGGLAAAGEKVAWPQRLLVCADQHEALEVPVTVVAPQELLLDGREVAATWESATGVSLAPDEAERLRQATDGWLAVVETAGTAWRAASGRPRVPGVGDLLGVAGVAAFLRLSVLATLPTDLRGLLPELSLADRLDPALWAEVWAAEEWRRAALDRLIGCHGLFVDEADGHRLPRLLLELVRRERAERWGAAAERAARRRLGLAHFALDRPIDALRELALAGDPERLVRLLALDWEELLAGAPADLLRAALAAIPPETVLPPAVRLLALGARLATGGPPGAAAAGLVELRDGRGTPPRVAALALLLAAAAGAAEDGASAGAGTLAGLAADPTLPRELRGLAARCAGLSEAAAGEDANGGAAPGGPSLAALLAERAGAGGATSGDPDFELRLLGAPGGLARAPGGARRELRWTLRRAFKALAFLASSPAMRAGKEELIEAVWPDVDAARIRRNFHPTLSHLRTSLGKDREALLLRNGVYELNPALAWRVDAVEMVDHVTRGRELAAAGRREEAAAAWEAAWRLYHGPFLEGGYEPWVVERRDTLHALYLGMLRDLGDLYFELGNLTRSADAYRTVLLGDPLQERIHIAIMRTYAQSGRRDLVRRQYARLTNLLREELGVEPLPETTEEYHRLMA